MGRNNSNINLPIRMSSNYGIVWVDPLASTKTGRKDSLSNSSASAQTSGKSWILDPLAFTKTSRKDQVIRLQELLYLLGLYEKGKSHSNAVDGILGSNTRSAIAKAKKLGYDFNETTLTLTPGKNSGNLSKQNSEDNSEIWQPTFKNGRAVNTVMRDGKVTDDCARYANGSLKLFDSGYKSSGNAWTRNSVSGASIIYSGYTDKPDATHYKLAYEDALKYLDKKGTITKEMRKAGEDADKRNYAAAENFKRDFDVNTLDKDKVYAVNMYFKNSPSRAIALMEGRDGITGTHTGNLYWNKNENKWKVSHNIHGVVKDDPYESVLGSGKNYGITAISDIYKANNKFTNFVADNLGLFLFQLGGAIKSRSDFFGKALPEVVVFPRKTDNAWTGRNTEGFTSAISEWFDRKILGNNLFNEEFIPLENYDVKFNDINTRNIPGRPLIFGSTYINTKNLNTIGTPDSFFAGLKLGDDNVDISRYSRWYGFENGKLKVGNRGSFKKDTLITPIVNKDYVITEPINEKFDLGSINSKFIIYTGNGQNAVGVTAHNKYDAINKYIKKYGVNKKNPAHAIQLDDGRYGVSSTTSTANYTRRDTPRGNNQRIWGITLTPTVKSLPKNTFFLKFLIK